MQKWILVHKSVDFKEYFVKDPDFGKSYYFGIDGYGEEHFTEYHEVKCDNNEKFPKKGPWLYNEERYEHGKNHILGVFDDDNNYVEDLDEAMKCRLPFVNESSNWNELIQKLLSSNEYIIYCICAPWREGGLYIGY